MYIKARFDIDLGKKTRYSGTSLGKMEQELITLGILFLFALIGGILAARFKQPMLMGLLVVGALIGPHAFGLIKDAKGMDLMIEFGAVLMLFVLGLEFDIPRLQKIGLKAILIATLNSAVLTFVGFGISLLLGFSVQASLFMGVVLAFGSTVVIVKVLENKGLMDRQEVPLLIAILIIEDIIAVMVITFFSGVRDKSAGLIGNIEFLIISMCILILVYVLFLKFVKPSLAWLLEQYNSDEIMTFTALAMCAGFAYFASLMHLSAAVGAFLAGSIVASLPNAKGFEKAISPYNLIISSFFFIAIGTLINFQSIAQNIMVILVLVAVVIVIKLTAFSSMVYFFANIKGSKMFFSSIAMFSVGEFSLLVAKESAKFNIGIDLLSISAAIVAISAVVMSLTINYSDRLYQPTVENLPWKFRKKMDHFSEYIKAVTEELDIDVQRSKAIKKTVVKGMYALLATLFIIFGWRKLSIYIPEELGIAAYILTIIAIAAMIFYLISKLKSLVKIIAEIFDNATNTRSAVQSKRIVRRAIFGSVIAGIALIWPFAMFLLDLPALLILVSVAMLLLAIWQFQRIASAMHANSVAEKEYFPSLHKDTYVNNTKKINQGWKL